MSLPRSPVSEMIFCISAVHFSHAPLIRVIILTYIITYISSQSCMVLEGRGICASILFPEHFPWQFAHSRDPHLFGDAANSTSHWSCEGHYNPSKVVLSIITGEPSTRNISPSRIPTVRRAHNPEGGQLLLKAEWARSLRWKINVTQLPLRWILKRKPSGWEEQRLDLPVQAVLPGAYTQFISLMPHVAHTWLSWVPYSGDSNLVACKTIWN